MVAVIIAEHDHDYNIYVISSIIKIVYLLQYSP